MLLDVKKRTFSLRRKKRKGASCVSGAVAGRQREERAPAEPKKNLLGERGERIRSPSRGRGSSLPAQEKGEGILNHPYVPRGEGGAQLSCGGKKKRNLLLSQDREEGKRCASRLGSSSHGKKRKGREASTATGRKKKGGFSAYRRERAPARAAGRCFGIAREKEEWDPRYRQGLSHLRGKKKTRWSRLPGAQMHEILGPGQKKKEGLRGRKKTAAPAHRQGKGHVAASGRDRGKLS